MFNRLYYTLILLFFIFWQANGDSFPPLVKKSLFTGGKWIKIETASTGIHKIYFSWMKSIGFQHPENVKIFGSRNEAMSLSNAVSENNSPVQIPTMRFTETNGNESLLFFVQGAVIWKYEPVSGQYIPKMNQAAHGKSLFYLTEDSGSDLRIQLADQPAGSPDIRITDYDEYGFWGEENINLIESGNRWFTTLIQGGNILKRTFPYPDRIEKEPVILKMYAAGRSSLPTGMEVSINTNAIGNLNFVPVQPEGEGDFASADSLKMTRVISGTDISISMRYNGTTTDQSWFDYATFQFRNSLHYTGTPLLFRDSRSVLQDKIFEFQVTGSVSGLLLWEVSNPLSPKQKPFQRSNGLITFRTLSDSLRNYLLFDPAAQFPGVNKTEEVQNEDIMGLAVPQFLILTPSALLTQANRLADFHRNSDGLSTKVVTVESVFNEFSGGYPDISAIRNFVRNLYQQKSGSDGSVLKYLLLFGKGTCDPVHESNENNPNWIPSFQSENSLSRINSFVTDDFFGRIDSDVSNLNGNISLGIGRIPAATIDEATISVDKIIHYHESQTLGDWRNNITFIGDDEDSNIHVNDSESLASMVNEQNPEYRTLKIYLDSYPQVLTPEERYPAVNEAIRRSVQTGDLIVNYIGHASEDGLAAERVLTNQDIDGWSNKDKLPLFVTATCEFSRWDMTMKRSAGERLFFHQGGGAIALLSATRLVYSASNFEINKSFFLHVFEKDASGNHLRLGDLIRQVKNENSGTVNTLKFCLLGDPALQLDCPEYRCTNISINNQPLSQFDGVLSPMTIVTIVGEVQDSKGTKMDQFSGTLSAMVYDQPTGKMTLGNGGLPPFSYSVQENLLFNGSVPVKNGVFTYSFMVPKDVSFNPEAGLIRYYFTNGTIDANGSFADIHFNGNGSAVVTDTKGPDIRLYLENEKFQDGGTVSANPLLMVFLSDESGINTSGSGIGHDITLEIDGTSADPVILNDFYRAGQGSWKSGTIYYLLSTLSAGQHSLKLKVWDNMGNSTIAIIHFVVNNAIFISNIYNYPNPFQVQTRFVITHNRNDELMDVKLEIMDLTGRIISSSQQTLASQGYTINDLFWNPREAEPVPVYGVYIYRITLTSLDGNHSSRSGRLIWNK